MRERPILFSAPMVRAILEGRKTQTRRAATKNVRHPDLGNLYAPGALVLEHEPQHVIDRCCPYGQPGDRLWVREAWGKAQIMNTKTGETRYQTVYRADNPDYDGFGVRWAPSIHMRREDSRILLEITAVRVERLNDISEADAVAEGVVIPVTIGMTDINANVAAYRDLWETINGPGSWAANPWVWVVEFRRVEL